MKLKADATYASLAGLAMEQTNGNELEPATGTLDGLEGLPVEIILDIYCHLDVGDIFQLSQTNTLFHGLFQKNKAQILLPALQREFRPFEELLQVYTASDDDLRDPSGAYQRRQVIYRRYPGDAVGIVLCRGSTVATRDSFQSKNGAAATLAVGRPNVVLPSAPVRTVALTARDLGPLLKHCAVIRKWEGLYPQLHWLFEPEDCRGLLDSEKEKLRRALYRWWLHARYFHGDSPRPRQGEPEPFVEDPRTRSMRVHSTSELMELKALMVSVKNLIRHYIFPNLEQKLSEVPPSPLEQIIELSIRERIVDTYAKLDPQELMFYFENLYSYPRKRLVNDVNHRHPTFVHDQESLHAAIRAATGERHWLIGLDNLDEVGSIVGPVCMLDDRLRKDGTPDASIPAPGVARRARGDWAPPGDDGRALAERDTYQRLGFERVRC